jgi:hypothetical protein
LTNKAIILLKTKDRKNEQSQTKPICAAKLLKIKKNHYQQSHYVVENKGRPRFGESAIGGKRGHRKSRE